jgi:hypothetical protein
MPRPRRGAKLRRSTLTDEQWQELAWGKGSDRGPGAFLDDRHKRAAWEAHRDELMALEAAGSRPAAFWEFDVSLPGRVALAAFDAQVDADWRCSTAVHYEREEWKLRYLIERGELQLEEARELVMMAGQHEGPREHWVQRRGAIAMEYLNQRKDRR